VRGHGQIVRPVTGRDPKARSLALLSIDKNLASRYRVNAAWFDRVYAMASPSGLLGRT
jgi:hypothetical protein